MYDVAIIGAGIMGAADLYAVSKTTNLSAILFEKDTPGKQASHNTHNSQTLHIGDIESQYTAKMARKVRDKARHLERYIKNKPQLARKTHKMLIAVGKKEIYLLRKRYAWLKRLFPGLVWLDKEDIAKKEPAVTKERTQDIAAIGGEGYAVDFGKAAEQLVKDAHRAGIDVRTKTEVTNISRTTRGLRIHTKNSIVEARALIISAGAHSLTLAHQLGLAKHYAVFPVAGGFLTSTNTLKGKVYTMQRPGIPFVAVHGDPDMRHPRETRWGPTAYPVPFLEWGAWRTLPAVLKSARFTRSLSTLPVIFNKNRTSFFLQSLTYKFPFVGKRQFAKQVRKIVPSIKASDLRVTKHLGGVRPQVINTTTREIVHGESRLTKGNVIVNLTPSPGASTCLATANEDAAYIAKRLS